MKTSARNQLKVNVGEIKGGGVICIDELDIGDGITITGWWYRGRFHILER